MAGLLVTDYIFSSKGSILSVPDFRSEDPNHGASLIGYYNPKFLKLNSARTVQEALDNISNMLVSQGSEIIISTSSNSGITITKVDSGYRVDNSGVKSINSATGDLTLTGGNGVSVDVVDNVVTISNVNTGVQQLNGRAGSVQIVGQNGIEVGVDSVNNLILLNNNATKVTSLNGFSNAVSIVPSTGLSVAQNAADNTLTLSNTGVLTFNDLTGNIVLTSGDGIIVSRNDALKQISISLASDRVESINNMIGALRLQAGANISLFTDPDTNTITIVGTASGSGGAVGVSDLNGLLNSVVIEHGLGVDVVTDNTTNTITINSSTINDLSGAITLEAGTNVTLSQDDTTKTITISAESGQGGESVLLYAGNGISITEDYDDGSGTLGTLIESTTDDVSVYSGSGTSVGRDSYDYYINSYGAVTAELDESVFEYGYQTTNLYGLMDDEYYYFRINLYGSESNDLIYVNDDTFNYSSDILYWTDPNDNKEYEYLSLPISMQYVKNNSINIKVLREGYYDITYRLLLDKNIQLRTPVIGYVMTVSDPTDLIDFEDNTTNDVDGFFTDSEKFLMYNNLESLNISDVESVTHLVFTFPTWEDSPTAIKLSVSGGTPVNIPLSATTAVYNSATIFNGIDTTLYIADLAAAGLTLTSTDVITYRFKF